MHSSGWRICFWQWGNLPFFLEKLFDWVLLPTVLTYLFLGCWIRTPKLGQEGASIDYQPPCPVSRIGSTTPTLKKLMKTQAAPTIVMYQSSKRKTAQGTTQKTITRKILHRMRPSAAQVKQLPLISKWYLTSNPIPFCTVINQCVSTCSGCGIVVPGIQVSINWTFIGWSSKGVNFGWNNRCF